MIGRLLRDLRAARALGEAKRLVGQVYKPQGVIIWLTTPNRNLAKHSPIELILHDCPAPVLVEARRVAGS